MKKCKAVVRSDYVGCDMEFEFEMPDDCTQEEIENEAWKEIKNNLEWYAEIIDEESEG